MCKFKNRPQELLEVNYFAKVLNVPILAINDPDNATEARLFLTKMQRAVTLAELCTAEK